MESETKPNGWGQDSLTAFIDMARNNEFATFANYAEIRQRLVSINDAFYTLADNLHNPSDPIPVLLFFRAHSSYLAAVRLSMGGQVAEAYPLMRSALEAAMYAHHVDRVPKATKVWLKRREDADAKRKCKGEFTIKNVRESLDRADNGLAERISELYDMTIEFGGHPNEISILSLIESTKNEKVKRYDLSYLTGEGNALKVALLRCARIAVAVLRVFELVFGARFKKLGLGETVTNLEDGLGPNV